MDTKAATTAMALVFVKTGSLYFEIGFLVRPRRDITNFVCNTFSRTTFSAYGSDKVKKPGIVSYVRSPIGGTGHSTKTSRLVVC